MRYYLDTEFIESPGTMQLISIGIVGQDDRTFYAENTSFDERFANDWVRVNVLHKLKWWTITGGGCQPFSIMDDKQTRVFGTISEIKDRLLAFFKGDSSPEFWGYFADYDWVIFCWIFGGMEDLPENFPKYCQDLKQVLDERWIDAPPDPEGEHNALVDAMWNRDLYASLMETDD